MTTSARISFPSSITRRALVAGSAAAAVAAAMPSGARHMSAQDAPKQISATITRSQNPAQPIHNDAPAHVRIAQETGVTLNFQPVADPDWQTKRQTMLATDQLPDLFYVGSINDIREYTNQDVFLSLDKLIDENGPTIKQYLASNPQFDAVRVDSKLYYLPSVIFNWRELAPMPMIRMDIVEQLGLTPPTTFDELLTVVGQMVAATPGSVGWTNRNKTGNLINLMAYPLGSGAGCYFDEEVDGGRWVFGPITPEFQAALAYLAKAYTSKVLDPEFAITPADAWQTKNGSGQGLFTWDNMSFGVNWNAALRAKDPGTKGWQPIPTIAGPKGARQRNYDFIREGWGIGKHTKDPAALIRMMDWMLGPDGIDTTNWGIEGQHFTRNTPLPQSIQDYSAQGLTAAMPGNRNALLPAIKDKYAATSDPYRTFQSDTGTGLLDFCLAIDDTITWLWSGSPEIDSWFQVTANDPGLRKPVPQPPFTVAEAKQLTDLNRSVNEILEPAYDQVILGQISMDDYANVAKSAASSGAKDIEDLYNTAQSRLA